MSSRRSKKGRQRRASNQQRNKKKEGGGFLMVDDETAEVMAVGGKKTVIINIPQMEASLCDMFPFLEKTVVKAVFAQHQFQVEKALEELEELNFEKEKADHLACSEGALDKKSKPNEDDQALEENDQDKKLLTDEEVAMALLQQMEREEKTKLELQEREDAFLARRLQQREQQGGSALPPQKDKRRRRRRGRKGKANGGEGENEREAGEEVTSIKEGSEDTCIVGEKTTTEETQPHNNEVDEKEEATKQTIKGEAQEVDVAEQRSEAKGKDLKEKAEERGQEDDEDDMLEARLKFIQSMFSEFEAELLRSLYEENACDLERTIECLITLSSIAEDNENQQLEEAVEEDDEEDEEAYEIDEEQLEGSEETEQGEAQLLSCDQQQQEGTDSGGDFMSNLRLLAEMFPWLDRSNLALVLEHHNDDLKATIDALLPVSEQEKGEAALNNNSNYATTDAMTPPRNNFEGHSTKRLNAGLWSTFSSSASITSGPQVVQRRYQYVFPSAVSAEAQREDPKAVDGNYSVTDLSSKLKLQQLVDQYGRCIDPEILESVFLFNQLNLSKTISALCSLYPNAMMAHRNTSTLPSSFSASPYVTAAMRQAKTTEETKREANSTTFEKDLALAQQLSKELQVEDRRRQQRKQLRIERRKQQQFQVVRGRSKRNRNRSDPCEKKSASDYRQLALSYAEVRKRYFMEATRAYLRGDGKAAAEFSRKGREYDRKIQEAHNQICEAMFPAPSLSPSSPPPSIINVPSSVDMHGLHVAAALQLLERLLTAHAVAYQRGRRGGLRHSDGAPYLSVITGIGNHSEHGIARIKPAVINYLTERGYHFKENGGVVVVKVKTHI
ncbi:NEDD4-binding protein 2 [Balamuthia mandrillaris]